MSLLFGASLILLVGCLLLRRSRNQRRHMGLPDGEIIFQDHAGQLLEAELLTSEYYGIRGKPDCLIRTPEGIVPVELKQSSRPPAHNGIYPNHKIQVLAYCVLATEHYGEPVPYGLVLYGENQARKVYPSEDNLTWLFDVVEAVRQSWHRSKVERSHQLPGRCSGCGLRDNCGQMLLEPTVPGRQRGTSLPTA